MNPNRITVVGAGFAGLTAIRRLRESDAQAELTLVAPLPELHYLPGIIWIPSGLRTRQDLIVPLHNFLERQRVRFVAAEATGVGENGRVLHTTEGDIANDGLVIATGGRFLKKLPGILHSITPCEGIAAAERIRDRLRALQGGVIAVGFAGNPQEPSSMRGGPMFEFLFGIDRQLRREGRRDRFKLVFFSPAAEPGNRLGQAAVQRLLREMQRRGVETHLGHKLVRFEADKVVTEGGEITADMILFMPGLTGAAWLDGTSLPRSPGGLLQGDAQCRVPGWRHVYVAGDGGSFPGPDWMPKQAHMADLQAAAAAENLLAELRGQSATATFKVELACIVDALDRGMLVVRTPTRNLVLPAMRPLHWAKRGFEKLYLRQYR
ncbi:MAG: NAD(P)/FAD-dependent oxidoreductase [Burkholderiaceae bacterium]|nr:NAD(P)/FAD-dependent oxidoreductase [Burkholderiaceae bacterium]